ncbi:hypothetical protein [Microbacterium sp. NPDC089188]|uniref:hypothetical protein n=1 Tax=Microbacterium sp. NPDC089188 TaxID=3154971 RepID=UPI003448DB95
MGSHKRGRGRPRREYRIRVRAERRATPDYAKLARALLEHAAMEQAKDDDATSVASSKVDASSAEQPEVSS